MRCSNEECDPKLFTAVTRQEAKPTLPKCKSCSSVMKPHCMFFDEFYQERWYRSDSVTKYMQDCDGLIVIGSSLQVGMCISMVNMCINDNVTPVVEVNLESAINRGYNV